MRSWDMDRVEKRATHGDNDETRHTRSRVVRVLLDEAWVDNEHDTVDGDRRLGDVRSQHDFARTLGCGLKDLGLHVAREIGVDGRDDQFGYFVA